MNTLQPTQSFERFLRHQLRLKNMTQDEFAKKAGIHKNTLKKLLNNGTLESKLSTYIQIADALEMYPTEIIRKALPYTIKPKTVTKYPDDYSGFVRDVTIPDGTVVMVGQTFEKIWEIINQGPSTWKNRKLICDDEEITIIRKRNGKTISKSPISLKPHNYSIDIPETAPSKNVRLSVTFTAPDFPCSTISHWKMIDHENDYCFPNLIGIWCSVKVISI